jgi:MFS family permease
MEKKPTLKLSHYFGLETLNAVNVTLFVYCAFFWTKSKFGYSDRENLLLVSVHGFIYIFASRIGGKLSDRIGYDLMLLICFLGSGLTLLLGWLPTWHYTPFVVFSFYTIFIAGAWPTLEAVVLHRPGKASMPDRLGIYNVAWGFGDGVGFFLSGFLFSWRPDSILWVTGIFHILQCFWLKFGPKSSDGDSAMTVPHSGDEFDRPTKRKFMYTAWLANGLAFLMVAVFSALTPQMGDRLGFLPKMTIWLACTLLFARAFAFVIFWKWEQWHYQMKWSQVALWTAPVCLAFSFFSNNVILVFVSLIFFGLATGLSYSGSLYYSLDYGENKGEHGGLHESILGIGIFLGPFLSFLVSNQGSGIIGAQWTTILLAFGGNLFGFILIHYLSRKSAS